MSDEIDKLTKALEDLTAHLKSGGGSGLGGGSPTPSKPKQEESGFKAMASSMGQFAVGLLSVGTVLKGLSGTREGYQLDYAANHLFYEIADMMRGPVRFITNELEGLARVMHHVNAASPSGAESPYANPWGPNSKRWEESHFQSVLFPGMGDGKRMHRALGPDDPDPDDPRFARLPKKVADRHRGMNIDDHLQPILHTSFGDVAGLQQRMQALSTENPAQEKGLSLIETIAKAVIKMAYNQETADNMFPENPAIKKD